MNETKSANTEYLIEKKEDVFNTDKMNKDSFEYDWDWIEDVGNFIENDPFMQSHRGREYAISIGLTI